MASGIRIEYPGAFYHIKARGNRRESLAASDGLRAFGFTDTAKGRLEWLGRLERRATEEEAENCGLAAPTPCPPRLSVG